MPESLVAARQPAPRIDHRAARVPDRPTAGVTTDRGIVRLQRAAGNRGMHHLLSARTPRPGITGAQPNAEHARDGERRAEDSSRRPAPSPADVSLITPVLSTPVLSTPVAMVQRKANIGFAPTSLACIVMDVHGTPGELNIFFDENEALLSGPSLALIENYVGLWVGKGLSPDLTIAGYASADGTERRNWRLSCQRAEAVKAALLRLGVPEEKTTMFAHGETSDFNATLPEPNRRATIDSTPGTGPVITPILVPLDNFAGRSTARFGLAESILVSYSATPSIAAAEHFGVQWAVVAGTGTVLNLPFVPALYTAGNTAATEQLALVVSSGPAAGTRLLVRNIIVIAPIVSYMQQVPSSGLCHTTGMASVGFLGNTFMLPADVSFSALQTRENGGTGIAFGSKSGSNGRVHATGSWASIGTGNSVTGCQENSVDSVSTTTATAPIIGGVPNWTGFFHWPIQWQYRAPGGSIVSYMVAHHLVAIDAAGTAMISKAGAGPFSRKLTDPTSSATGGGTTHSC